jgi:hypothetical protein
MQTKIIYLAEVPNKDIIEEVTGPYYDYIDKHSFEVSSIDLILELVKKNIKEFLKSKRCIPLVYQLYDISYLDIVNLINIVNDSSCIIEYIIITIKGEEQEYDTNIIKEVIIK